MSNWPTSGNLTGTLSLEQGSLSLGQGALSVGQGERGKSLEYEWRGTELGIRVEGEKEYQFVNLAGEGTGTGREIELQVGSGCIQWRYKNEEEWKDLISIDSLKGIQGPQGPQGQKGEQGLKGDKGEQGLPGKTGPQGIQGIQGERGPQGLKGDRGETGPQGPKGAQGIPGPKGDTGLQGEKGKDGTTPNITVGTVTTLESGEKATVTRSGTKENPVFNFGIPKGEKGAGENIALVTTEIVDNTLTLTTDKYQTTTMEDNTTIVLPEVEELTEIYLIFNTASELTITFPKIRWYRQPNIRKDKINKFIFTYINGEWLGEHFSYYNSAMMPIMDGLICWLDGHDLPVAVNNRLINGTVWENKVQDREGAVIRTIKGNDVECVENGYFRTNGNGYVQLPSFAANNEDGVSVFVDAKINKRPATAAYEKIFTLGYGTSWQYFFSMMYGLAAFGQIRTFETKTNDSLLGNVNTAVFPMSIKIGVTTSKAKNYLKDSSLIYTSSTKYNQIFNNNFLNAENPTILNTGDVSYGLVLIYNRNLTEEEMLHNYMYSLSIKRGE